MDINSKLLMIDGITEVISGLDSQTVTTRNCLSAGGSLQRGENVTMVILRAAMVLESIRRP